MIKKLSKRLINIKHKGGAGFTMMEVLLVLGISSMVIFVAAKFLIGGFTANLFGEEQELAIKNARKVAQKMVREVREVTNSERGDYMIDVVEDQTLSFYSDIDKDNSVEKIRYFLDGTVLKRGIINPTGNPVEYLSGNEIVEELAEFMNNQGEPIFTYYDTDNNIIANPVTDKAYIRLIHISLKINVTPTVAPNDFYVEMDSHIRNLKDNL